ncbi:hypothetical protein Kisp01_66100 [Kineosporia sp. NBRC 101677]|nr:hypothetical protein Kisp01_66100 [Kineosporia sp. NBRC 101677]
MGAGRGSGENDGASAFLCRNLHDAGSAAVIWADCGGVVATNQITCPERQRGTAPEGLA